jgi:hypothetical protein
VPHRSRALCVNIPHIKGCFLENGVRDLLRSSKQVLGCDSVYNLHIPCSCGSPPMTVPIVIVLTQLNLYDGPSQHSTTIAGQISEDAELTKNIHHQSCVEPLEVAVDSEIPHVVVSGA